MRRALLVFVVACGGTSPHPEPVGNTAPTAQPVVDDREAVEDTAVLVRSLAFEMYPEWASGTPNKCPATLGEIATNLRTQDAWGTELRMFCGDNVPAGATEFAVVSAGADRKFGTADDVKSWE